MMLGYRITVFYDIGNCDYFYLYYIGENRDFSTIKLVKTQHKQHRLARATVGGDRYNIIGKRE